MSRPAANENCMLYDHRRAAAGSPPLPPGFRFRPTDEELLTHYLARKAADAGFSSAAVRVVDLYNAEPWDLMPPPHEAAAAAAGGGEDGGRYYFCRRSVKFPSGLRTNRATLAGYWKSTGKDKVVLHGGGGGGGDGGGPPLGARRTLVFYRGRLPRGDKTNWVMHEYRLLQGHATSPAFARTQSEWVICRVFMKKPLGDNKNGSVQHDQETFLLPLDDHLQEAAIDGSDGKTPADATSDSAHANFFSNAPTVAPGDQETEAVLQLNHDQLLMNYSVSDLHASAMASPAEAAMLLRNELAEAADPFDLLPQLLHYEGFPQDFF